MSKPNIIAERDERTALRKKAKKEFDSIITLSNKTDLESTIKLSASIKDKTVRLLDEGMVVDAYGNALFYIEKGVLQAFYDNLADDYDGTINLGHMDLATHPIILGQWNKADLTLVDIGGGRKALDVELKLNEELNIVQDLRKQPFTLGVSAEFFYTIDWEATERTGLEFLNSVTIKDFAIVGDAGNVNSGGIDLKGGNEVGKFAELTAKYLGTKKLNADEVAEETTVEETTEEVAEDAIGETTKADEVAEAIEAGANAIEERDALLALIDEMDARNVVLSARNEELEAELALRTERQEKALKRLSGLAENVSYKKDGNEEQPKDNKNLSAGSTADLWGRV